MLNWFKTPLFTIRFLYFSQTLFTYPDNFRAAKALIAAQYAKANVKVSPNFVFGETNKTKEFQKKFPGGKVSNNKQIKPKNPI